MVERSFARLALSGLREGRSAGFDAHEIPRRIAAYEVPKYKVHHNLVIRNTQLERSAISLSQANACNSG